MNLDNCPASLGMRELQFKIALSLTPQPKQIILGKQMVMTTVKHLENCLVVLAGVISLWSHYGNRCVGFSKADMYPTIPFMGINSKSYTTEIFAHPCSFSHYLQYPEI